MAVDLAKLFADVEAQWSTKKGLLLILATLAGLQIWLFTSVDLSKVSRWQWILFAVVLAGVVGIWWFTALPRVPRRKVGFGVAIMYEDMAEGRRVQSDFVARLRELVQASEELRHTFQFVEFDARLARRFVEGEVDWLATKTNCHFVIYGQAKSRVLLGGSSYVVELRGFVRHARVQDELQRRFGADFSELLPSRLVVKDPDSLLQFEFAARHIDIVARYVIGVAAAISGDVAYAEQLLLDARARLEQISKSLDGPPLGILRGRIRDRLGEVYEILLGHCQRKYILRRDIDALQEAERVLARRREVVEDNYFARQAAALCAFVLHRDVAQARREYEACKQIDDGSWRYGEAFLSAYEGNLDQVYKRYRDAFGSPLLDASVPVQCEEFIQLVLEREPERYWLHFCLGLINYKGKADLAAARRDFMNFSARVESGRFQPQLRAVQQWLREIDSALMGECRPQGKITADI